MPYDSNKDFVPVALAASTPNLLVVNPALPANSVKELIALARSKPGTLTVAESGVPAFDVSVWFGVVAPAGTPQPVIAKLNGEINAILKLPEVRQSFNNQGVETAGRAPAEFAAFIAAQTTKRAKVVGDSGTKAA